MTRRAPPAERLSPIGSLVAVFALLAQILLGAVGPAMAAPSAAVRLGDVPICHAGTPADTGPATPARPARHGMDHALCPLCCHAPVSVALPERTPLPPAPTVAVAASPAQTPPARAPPTPSVPAANFPTGPPVLA